MKELIKILADNTYISVSYSNDIFTVFLTGNRYYEIHCTAHKETTLTDEDTGYSEGICSVTVTSIVFYDALIDDVEPIELDNNIEDLEEVLGSEFSNEF